MAIIKGTNHDDDGTRDWTTSFPFYKKFKELKGTSLQDTIYGFKGNDILRGYDSGDKLYGGSGNDKLYGGNGGDKLYGGSGSDKLYGDEGWDTLNGGLGADIMYGGTGSDTYYVDSMSDKIIEYFNQGYDKVYSSVSTSVKWLPNNVEGLTLQGNAYYGDGNDSYNSIEGTNNANSLYGYGGSDSLYGNGGNDYLNGGDGNDHLIGGTGKDTLTGGSGGDIFYFNSTNDSPAGINRDKITDFKWWEDDKIDISSIDANLYIAGNQEFSANQLSYDADTEIFSADVWGGADLEIQLTGAGPSFSTTLDVIVEMPVIIIT